MWPHSRRKERFCDNSVRVNRTGVVSGDASAARFSGCSEVAHGLVEAHAENLDEEVNGVAREVALWPAPVAVFDDQAGISGQLEVIRSALDHRRGQPENAPLS